MPVYEYQVIKGNKGCKYCKKSFEVMQKVSDDPLDLCPECESPIERIISQSTFHLKGTGWYATDYASKKDSKPSENSK